MSDYQEKYQKYKKKYLDLKEQANKPTQSGGTNGTAKFPLEDEIFFWGRQHTEHHQWQYLALEDTDNSLKKEAYGLYKEWLSYLKTNFLDKGILAKPDLFVLPPEQLALVSGKVDTKGAHQLLKRSKDFQNKLLGEFQKGWIGWIFPSVVQHMQDESNYFERKLNGPAFSAKEEIEFINKHHSGEIGATAHLIDPGPENSAIVQKALSYATKTMPDWSEADKKLLRDMDAGEQASLLRLSIKYSTELTKMAQETGQKIEAKQLKSIISPVIAHHVLREFARFTQTLQSLSA